MTCKLAVGGGCHWCTEAIFKSLKGVVKVDQGFVSSVEQESFSEAVIVHFNPNMISLKRIIEVHLYTHNSTSNHSMRAKYRSAVYAFSMEQASKAENVIHQIQSDFDKPLVTKVLTFKRFKSSRASVLDYYYQNPNKPFCERYIHPKLLIVLNRFSENASLGKPAV
ncbi:peptide-methionine (S)-S-oxide reductase [Aestuariivivens sediminis]|uniref:peptide-methionine (S)-S-oxide reductase n=1 Tax=Aestuariivivens sediminis TaxID=2913557 RepID=UPI001F5A78E7|nr:peptide-methionine (S)-S-oxide reductase [Aestuariivivens sediminis]